MARIQPSAEALAGSKPTPASVREHLGAAPTLLPSIIFQELVFGQDLGSGSFSTVRYCKHVVRGTPASGWPEYAAKVRKAELHMPPMHVGTYAHVHACILSCAWHVHGVYRCSRRSC